MDWTVHFLRVEMMQDGTEGQAVPPGGAEVSDLHPWVAVGDALTPLEEGLAGGHQVLEGDDG